MVHDLLKRDNLVLATHCPCCGMSYTTRTVLAVGETPVSRIRLRSVARSLKMSRKQNPCELVECGKPGVGCAQSAQNGDFRVWLRSCWAVTIRAGSCGFDALRR